MQNLKMATNKEKLSKKSVVGKLTTLNDCQKQNMRTIIEQI